jgi:hypothetical protein
MRSWWRRATAPAISMSLALPVSSPWASKARRRPAAGRSWPGSWRLRPGAAPRRGLRESSRQQLSSRRAAAMSTSVAALDTEKRRANCLITALVLRRLDAERVQTRPQRNRVGGGFHVEVGLVNFGQGFAGQQHTVGHLAILQAAQDEAELRHALESHRLRVVPGEAFSTSQAWLSPLVSRASKRRKASSIIDNTSNRRDLLPMVQVRSSI